MTLLTDIHCHLNMLEISADEAIEKAKDAGVNRFVSIGAHPDDMDFVIDISKKYPKEVYCTIGIHPHDAKLYTQELENKIISYLDNPSVIAVGEIGLDYYYKNSEIEVQKKVFERQLEIAKDKNLPIEIHTRDAEKDTVEILKKVSSSWTGVVHCFTGTDYLAQEALKLGLDISISGIITFKSAEDLRNVVKKIPVDRIHVETDSPFLAPVPMRGKKNQPAFVVHTAEFVANLFGVEIESFKAQVQRNNERVFTRLQSKG